MNQKIYVIEEKSGFRDWQPRNAHKFKNAAQSTMKLYRQLSRIYKTNKQYRIEIYMR